LDLEKGSHEKVCVNLRASAVKKSNYRLQGSETLYFNKSSLLTLVRPNPQIFWI